jgi:hypothetical protein
MYVENLWQPLPVIIWVGHESNVGEVVGDYVNGGVNTALQDLEADFVANMRSDLGDIPVIKVQLGAPDNASSPEAYGEAAYAQLLSADAIDDMYLVAALDLQRNPPTDDIHWAKQGHEALAPRLALAVRQHIMSEAVNGTGPRVVSATYSGDTITLTLDSPINTTSGDYGDLFRVYCGGVEQTVNSANRHGSDTEKIVIVCSATLTPTVVLTYGHRLGIDNAARTDLVLDDDGMPLPTFGPLAVTP